MLLKISLEASVSVIYGGIASRWKVPQGFHLLNLSDSDFKISQNRNVYFLFFTFEICLIWISRFLRTKIHIFSVKGANLYKRAQEKANGDEGGEIE